ncbi:hypothetical protein JW948_10875 [bacterium]|nr:hypothetical protein [bacterium]
MKLDKNQKILYGALGGVVIVFMIWNFTGSGSKKKPVAGKAAQHATAAVNKITGKETPDNLQANVKKANIAKMRFDDWGRDPFKDNHADRIAAQQAARQEELERQSLVVKGIVRIEGRSYVMINDIILGEGEEKDGLYVERIENNDVFCRKGSKWFTLTWKEEP